MGREPSAGITAALALTSSVSEMTGNDVDPCALRRVPRRHVTTDVDTAMTDSSPHRDGSETRTLAATSLLPDDASLADYTAVGIVVRKLDITEKTLTRWARDPEHPCPPIYAIGGAGPRTKRVMETLAVNEWIKSCEEIHEPEEGTPDAPAA